ncbi:PAS domain-containing sensor histidine kinase [Massilia sp. H6]|uniref:hybrid sensor histidine kinase/response regulator n=1 Tax=Massilia sp. H6 TaxID=2970464 RepID=UPI002166DA2E|nr:PAS domain-containing sensor histidine kinase [Massilia sp. H6]UVW27943.1 ATP-binding protein [Massilia sp. H6]
MSRSLAFLQGGGQMGERIRQHDWASTALGSPETWPCSLRSAVALMNRIAQPAYLAWGPDQISFYNDRYLPILGSKHPMGLGQPAHALWAEIWDTLGPLNEAVLGGESLYFEEMPFTLDGQESGQRWFNFSYTPLLNDTGEIAGIYCLALETTEKVLTERKMLASRQALYRLNQSLEQQVSERTQERDRLWRNTQDVQVVIDVQGIFTAINPAFTSILGWLPEEVLGRSAFDFIVPDDDASQGALQHARQENLQTFQNRYRHKDGGVRWFSWVATPEAELIYASGRHITAEKEHLQALASAEETLRQSQKMDAIGQLTGGLAHDFNNLLAGIAGSLQLMQIRMQQGRFNEFERYIAMAQGASRRAAALTHRLLAFSRQQTLVPKPTNVNRLVADMHEFIQRTVGPSTPIEFVGVSDAWTTIVDASQLENALLNLCINARDAMPNGGRITIETANKWMDERAAKLQSMAEGQYLALSVSDTGTGMSKEVIARAFDPFFTTKPIGQGTGLGLSMIYGFAQQSGGQVRIYSELGQGTTVSIYLPRHHGNSIEETVASEIRTLQRSAQLATVLVVDDEPTVRMLLVDILNDLGYAWIEAEDSSAGLKILQSDARIDLLISDVGLPGGMNGRQMADAACISRPDLKVLFITGYAENAVLNNGYLAPGMAVLTKPFSIDVIADRIRSMIESGASSVSE